MRLLWIDNIYNDADYFSAGVTLEKPGLAGKNKEQILDTIR